MADSASESDSSSVDGGMLIPSSPASREQFQKRIESLQQENRVLKMELDTFRLRVKSLQEENRALRQASVNIQTGFRRTHYSCPTCNAMMKLTSRNESSDGFCWQCRLDGEDMIRILCTSKKASDVLRWKQAKAEQEEEFISNTLLKQIKTLKKEKETLALNYEQEEECLTNDLSRKLNQLRQEKVQLEQTLEQEQEALVNKLMRKIEKLEAETLGKQSNLEQLRREKVELENTLEQEQEALVNRLWKRMDKLEAEKRMLQEKLDQPVSAPPSPRDINNGDLAANLTMHVQHLRNEVAKLKTQLLNAQQEHSEKMAQFAMEERHGREENIRLQRKLQMEVERREALCRHLSESESSLEMDEERYFNEMTCSLHARPRAASSPVFHNPSPSSSRPLSPGGRDAFSPPNPIVTRCPHCNQPWNSPSLSIPGGQLTNPSQPVGSGSMAHTTGAIPIPIKNMVHNPYEKFAKPSAPPPIPPNTPSAQYPLNFVMGEKS